LPEIAARSIHHNAVMGSRRWIEEATDKISRWATNDKHGLGVDRLTTINTGCVTFIIGDQPVKNEHANRANPISKQAAE
jgi:hypothetical protein